MCGSIKKSKNGKHYVGTTNNESSISVQYETHFQNFLYKLISRNTTFMTSLIAFNCNIGQGNKQGKT